MVSLCHVTNIGHIHSKNCLSFYSTNAFTQSVKAYNQFISIDTYELKKLTVISFVALVDKIQDKIQAFYGFYLSQLYEAVETGGTD